MARNENPPFGRGETFFNGGTTNTSDGTQLEGHEWLFEDINPNMGATGGHTARTNRFVRCRVVRNASGIALLPKRLVSFDLTTPTDGRYYASRVAGYTDTTAERGYPVDEFLPAAGVPDGDLFWIVVDGPAMVLTPLANFTASIVPGDLLHALTAASSQATSAGRVDTITWTITQQPLANEAIHYIGYALSAVTSQGTNQDVLVEVGHW